MRGGTDRVSHIMQTIEICDQIIFLARICFSCSDLVRDVIQACLGCQFSRVFNGVIMKIEAEKL